MTTLDTVPGHGAGLPPTLVGPDNPVLAAGRARRAARQRPPRPVMVLSVAVGLVLVLPLVFLVIEAVGAGPSNVAHLVFEQQTLTLLWNTVRLAVVVTALCALIGTLAAWFVERTDLPGRHIWAVLVVVPFAIPDFVVSWGWNSLLLWVQGFRGAVLVMTLAVYPLVYLPVAASFRGADPGQEEVARSLGLSRLRTFWHITLGQARGAILGGCVLVSLVILAEYGAFEILGYRTFTTAIFTEATRAFDPAGACALSLVLVLLGVLVLGGDALARVRGQVVRTGAMVQRVTERRPLGRAKLPVLAAFTLLVAAALGVPVFSCIYWILEGGHAAFAGVTILTAALHTAGYGAGAAALATLMALPVALLVVRHGSPLGRLLERSTYLVMAMPGVFIAFTLSYFLERYADGFGFPSTPLLVLAYAILFFPLALVGVRASLAYAPVRLEEVARSLGKNRRQVFLHVTLRLVGPGLAAAFCLVFLAVGTELTATLLLIPYNVQTLATQFWQYQQNLSYGQAAPFALVIIAIAAVPSYVLARWFDRLPAKATRP